VQSGVNGGIFGFLSIKMIGVQADFMLWPRWIYAEWRGLKLSIRPRVGGSKTCRLQRQPTKLATPPRFLLAFGEQKPGRSEGMIISRSGVACKSAVHRHGVGRAVECCIFT